MDKLCKRWSEIGQWSRMNVKKTVFVEPRGGSREDFKAVLKGHYSAFIKAQSQLLGKEERLRK
ncbi:hypothetical protein SOVF_073170 [Spinacia oleracea]|nr:hypothetical protein SOVF_073170 [Spinacia oleracea]